MQRDYANLINLALARVDANIADGESRTEIEASYIEALHAFVDELLSDRRSKDSAIRTVEQDFDEISGLSEAALYPTYDKVRYDIINQIEEKAGLKPWQRTAQTRLVGLGGVLLVILLATGYFGLRQYSATPVTAPIDTRTGIEQRADALAKVLRFGDWGGSTRPGRGMIKKILLWPIEPTENEIAAAGEFARLIFTGAAGLSAMKEACNLPLQESGELSDGEVELLRQVSAHLHHKDLTWRNPPAMTILDAIRANYRC